MGSFQLVPAVESYCDGYYSLKSFLSDLYWFSNTAMASEDSNDAAAQQSPDTQEVQVDLDDSLNSRTFTQADSTGEKASSRITPGKPNASEWEMPSQVPQGIERYESLDELGRGGWGNVVQAHDQQLDRTVALKRINSSLVSDPEINRRFWQEAQVTSQLQHPSIVPVHELGVAEDGAPFYVMKLLEGSTLREWIRDTHQGGRDLPGGFSVELLNRFVDVCNALAYAHDQGIVHRDLKPSNIMVGNYGETIVVDWGLAKRIGSGPEHGSLYGIAAFQGNGRRSDSRGTGSLTGNDSNSLPFDEETLVGVDPSTPANTPEAKTPGVGTAGAGQSETEPTSQSALPGASELGNSGAGSYGRSGGSAAAGTAGDSSSTRYGAILGTPAYMSPEQSEGNIAAISAATDIYALGVIMYELLVGKNPFRTDDVKTTLTRVKQGKYRPPRAVNRRVPRPLAAICTTAMSRHPGDRYRSAQGIVEDIQHFLAGEPVSVYQELWWERGLRWCRRNRALTASLVGSAAVLTIASLLFGFFIQRAHQAERQARVAAESAHRQAMASLSEARQAGDAWLVDLSGSLQFFPGLDGLRNQLLRDAVEHYERLAASNEEASASADDSSPAALLENAKCYVRLGDLHRLLGEPRTAAEQYATAEQSLQAIAIAEPDALPDGEQLIQERLRMELINARIGQGLLAGEQGQIDAETFGPSEVADQLGSDAEWLQTFLNKDAVSAAYRLQALNTLTRVYLARSRDASIESTVHTVELSKAATAAQTLASERGEPRDHQLLQTVRSELASKLQQAGRLNDAAKQLQLQNKQISELIAQQPGRPDYLQTRAVARMQLAAVRAELGVGDLAVKGYRQAIDDLDKAWELSDADAFYRSNVAVSDANLGRTMAAWSSVDEDAQSHLEEAVLTLRQTIAQQGMTADDLVRMAECHESLAYLGEKQGDSNTPQHFDAADKCYMILEDHDQLSPIITGRWARLLAARARYQISQAKLEQAKADLASAQQKHQAVDVTELNLAEAARWQRLDSHLELVRSELLQTQGDAAAAKQAWETSIEILRQAAIEERDRPYSDAYPQAMPAIVDRLTEHDKPSQEMVQEANEWLKAIQSVHPTAEASADWQQQTTIVAWLRGDSVTASTAIDRAMQLRPGNVLNEVLRALIDEVSPADEAVGQPLETLIAQRPGDRRLQHWAAVWRANFDESEASLEEKKDESAKKPDLDPTQALLEPKTDAAGGTPE